MTNNKRSRGRPKKTQGQRRDAYLDVRLETNEKQAFTDAAKLSGVPLTAWVRERLRAAARKELQAAGIPVAFVPSVDDFLSEVSDG